LAAERVTSTAPAPGVDRYPAYEQEALLLAELLRNTRLSLLYAEAGTDKTAFLKLGLAPLLCRRAGDRVVPRPARSSGVVVPFPDRRSRSSAGHSTRRREIVVYVDCSGESPLTALREALYEAVAADPSGQWQAKVRLSGMLEDMGRRFEAHLIVLLDRFEDVPPHSPDEIDQFASELAEAIIQRQVPASFLIALAADARARLAGLRSRIPGFDDSSLKLTPPRALGPAVAPRQTKPAPPAAVEALPVLSEILAVPEGDSMPVAVVPEPKREAPAKKQIKYPRPRVEIRTEDVYAMIETALSRIAGKAIAASTDEDARALWRDDGTELVPPQQIADRELDPATDPSPGPASGRRLQEAIERLEERLRSPSEG